MAFHTHTHTRLSVTPHPRVLERCDGEDPPLIHPPLYPPISPSLLLFSLQRLYPPPSVLPSVLSFLYNSILPTSNFSIPLSIHSPTLLFLDPSTPLPFALQFLLFVHSSYLRFIHPSIRPPFLFPHPSIPVTFRSISPPLHLPYGTGSIHRR